MEPGAIDTGDHQAHSRRCKLFLGLALVWFLFVASGLNLSQLFFAITTIAKFGDPAKSLTRLAAASGVAGLSLFLAAPGGLCGAIGCAGLLARRGWAIYPLVAALVLLIWPLVLWTYFWLLWLEIDRIGSLLLLVQTVVTGMLVVILLGLAVVLRRKGKAMPPG